MRMRIQLLLVVASVILVGGSCETLTPESDRGALDARRQEIIAFAKSGTCTANSQCRFTGLGSKPCGGPREFIVYSTSLDTVKLFQMIAQYNQDEDAYNRKWGLVSDCSLPPLPDSIACVNGVCVKYRNGVPY